MERSLKSVVGNNMDFEKKLNKIENKEAITSIEIIKGSEAPEENKKNPFYNSYHWGMADWENKKLYLPDNSDEAVSFAIAAHELGHLIDKDRIQPDRFNFEPTYKEELRAWELGWNYLEKYIPEYYGSVKEVNDLLKIKNEIEKELMEITKLTELFYQETDKSKNDQRKAFLDTETGKLTKKRIDNLHDKVQEILSHLGLSQYSQTINWNRFSNVITKALVDIEKDNNKYE